MLPTSSRARLSVHLFRGAAIVALSLASASGQTIKPDMKEEVARDADARKQLITEIRAEANVRGVAFSAAKTAYAAALAERRDPAAANQVAAAAAFSAAVKAGSLLSNAANVAAIVTCYPAAVAVKADRSYSPETAKNSYAAAISDNAGSAAVANTFNFGDGPMVRIAWFIASGITSAATAAGDSVDGDAITEAVTDGIATATRAAGYSAAVADLIASAGVRSAVFSTMRNAAEAAAKTAKDAALLRRENTYAANSTAAAAAFRAAAGGGSRTAYTSNDDYAEAVAYVAARVTGSPDYAAILLKGSRNFRAQIERRDFRNVDSLGMAAIFDGITAGITAEARAAGYSDSSAAVTRGIRSGVYDAASEAGHSSDDATWIATIDDRRVAAATAAAAEFARRAPSDAAGIVERAITAAPDAAKEIVAAAVRAAPNASVEVTKAAVAAVAAVAAHAAAVAVGFRVGVAPDANVEIVIAAVTAAPGSIREIYNAVARAVSNESAQAIWDALKARGTPVPDVIGNIQMTPGGRRPPGDPTTTAPVRLGEGDQSQELKWHDVEVLYATDRKPRMPLDKWNEALKSKGSKLAYFGPDPDSDRERGVQMHYGLCTVTIPMTHKVTKLERPRFGDREANEKHFTISRISVLDKDGMGNAISEKAGPNKDAFIFIHGFNVTFNDAAMRAAQLAYDFDFMGAPILYSWSSAGDASFSGYNHDAENVKATEDRLFGFIDEVVRTARVREIHVVAHSMGNRALIGVLKRFADRRKDQNLAPENIFGEVVLAAPDFPVDQFSAPFAATLVPLAMRISLYASSDDKALQLSMKASRHSRLGLSGKDLFVMRGIDTIDATGIDTDLFSLSHSYFADARKVLDDLAAVLKKRAPDDAPRSLIKRPKSADLDYWVVKK